MHRRPNCNEAFDGCDPDSDIVFSLLDDFVWASCPTTDFKVRLGCCHSVTAGMRDFLAQCELGERLGTANQRK
jgi:hypothetical protein